MSLATHLRGRSTAAAPAFNPFSYGTPIHGYWAEGTRFAALGVANGGAVGAWPDEVLTSDPDLVQATAGSKPTYRSSSAAFNNKPVIEFDGTADNVKCNAWASGMSQPNVIVAVVKLLTYTQGFNVTLWDGRGSGNRHSLVTDTTPTPDAWWIYAGSGVISGGTVDTSLHLIVATYNGASSGLTIDGSSVVTGNAGAHTLGGLTVGATSVPNQFANMQIAFLSVYDTLSGTDAGNLRTACQSYYGTP